MPLHSQTVPTDLLINRTKIIAVSDLPIQLDSLLVLPNSISVRTVPNGSLLDTQSHEIVNGVFDLVTSINPDSLSITYQILPGLSTKPFKLLDTSWLTKKPIDKLIGYDYNPYAEGPAGDLASSGLNYTGSFARGISFGNKQDLVLNSSFNLQLSGVVNDDVEIVAAISDENIPLQAQGNTQQLQEFDKIFIQLQRKNTKLIAGDYELAAPKGHFLQYFKKLQGGTIENTWNFNEASNLMAKGSFAIARGKYTRYALQTQEGNQGPYRLRGSDGELFIIVLSGTERIYLNGSLLTRGANNDYIIDYNQGEISFTANRLITNNSRITVEFEYADQRYQRTLYALNTNFNYKSFSVWGNVYSESDSKTSGGQQELSEVEKQLLAASTTQNATASGIDSLVDGFNSNRITYKLIDTIIGGSFYEDILIYSTNPDSAKYTARFSEVGQNNGNYVQIRTAANGRVYGWVQPDPISNEPRGNFEPIVKLVAPVQKQVFSFGGAYSPSQNTTVSTEISISDNDVNRFSSNPLTTNRGIGVFADASHVFKLDSFLNKPMQIKLFGSAELVQEDYFALNPFRSVEFNRDWNVNQSINKQEVWLLGGASMELGSKALLKYELSSFDQDSIYQGIKNQGYGSFRHGGFSSIANFSNLQSESNFDQTNFTRIKFEASQEFRQLNNWSLGVGYVEEHNRRNDLFTDTLLNTSFRFQIVSAFIRSPANQFFNMEAGVNYRLDNKTKAQELSEFSKAQEVYWRGNLSVKKHSKLFWRFTVRDFDVDESFTTDVDDQLSYLGRINYTLNARDGFIRSNTSYELGSGQEKEYEFSYVLVKPGEGNYTWFDRNMDSIKQLDEFEVSSFQDLADHVRISTFTNNFIRSNISTFGQSLSITPKRLWKAPTGIKKVLTKLSSRSSVQINRKVKENEGIQTWNSFQWAISDTSLVSLNAAIRNTLFFNRTNTKYSFEVGNSFLRNRNILTTGYEERESKKYFVKNRWNISSKFTLRSEFNIGTRDNDSEFFNSRDYEIDENKIKATLTHQFRTNIRIELSGERLASQNRESLGGEFALSNEIGINTTYNITGITSLRMGYEFVNVDYDGQINTPLEFAMLNGLQRNQNHLWSLAFRRTVAKNVQLDIGYDGRKTGEASVVHLGRGHQ